MDLSLKPNEAADLQVPGQQAPWQLSRLDHALVLQTDAIVVAEEDRESALRGCLVANTLQGGDGHTRFVLNAAGQLALEQVIPPGDTDWDEPVIQAGIDRLSQAVAAARAAAAGVEIAQADQVDAQVRAELDAADPGADDLQALRALETLAEADPTLAALLSIDTVQGCALLEPDDESWSIGVAPTDEPDVLLMSAALMPLPDGLPAQSLLERALSLGAATVIGTDHWMGCDPAATVLALNTLIRPHLMNADELAVAIGGLLLMAQRMSDALVGDGAGAGGVAAGRQGLAPTADESLSMYAQIRA